jgi:hypothetical protein
MRELAQSTDEWHEKTNDWRLQNDKRDPLLERGFAPSCLSVPGGVPD